MNLHSTILIKASVNTVYQYTTDPRNLGKWVHGFKEYKSRKGRKRSTGSTAVQVFDDGGEILEIQEEVLSNVPNKEFVCHLSHKNMESEVTYRFLNQGDAITKLQVSARVRLKPVLFNLFSIFVKGPMRRQQEEDLRRLKNCIESL